MDWQLKDLNFAFFASFANFFYNHFLKKAKLTFFISRLKKGRWSWRRRGTTARRGGGRTTPRTSGSGTRRGRTRSASPPASASIRRGRARSASPPRKAHQLEEDGRAAQVHRQAHQLEEDGRAAKVHRKAHQLVEELRKNMVIRSSVFLLLYKYIGSISSLTLVYLFNIYVFYRTCINKLRNVQKYRW
jgi:hypothetical protein